MSKNWRVIDIITWGETFFNKRQFENPKTEIEWLLCSLLDCTRLDIYMRFEEILIQSQLNKLRSWVIRRSNNEPLQYITGSCEFYGRKFKLSPKVLIPRPETERLIDVALDFTINKPDPYILDIGTGSGCIAITMGLEKPDSTVLGIDCCFHAKNIAMKNSNELKTKNVNFSEMDILDTYPTSNFDYILSNPPYISKKEFPLLENNVKQFEPKVALTDFDDGLKFYNRYAKIAKEILNKDGFLILEIGLGNHPYMVKSIFENSGFRNIDIFDDYNGDPRIITIQF